MVHETWDFNTGEGLDKAESEGFPVPPRKPLAAPEPEQGELRREKGPRKAKRKPRQEMSTKTKKGDPFAALCKAHGLPEPVSEYEFAEEIGRKWRFDHCWPEIELAVEIQGSAFTGGRHVHPSSIRAEYEKLAWAAILGWRVMPVLPEEVESGKVFELLKAAFKESR